MSAVFDMPVALGSQPKQEGGIAFDVLERFCSSHEQTYAEFLESFMYLRKENLEKQKVLPPELGTKAEGYDEYKLAQRELSENSVQEGGKSPKNDQEVNNYLVIEEMHSEIVTAHLNNAGGQVLPGEIEEENAAAHHHYKCKHTALSFRDTPKVKEFNNKTLDQVLTDEVQAFTLDEDFDYDCVHLMPKYTEAELKAISALSKQKAARGEFNAEKLEDFAVPWCSQSDS
ncbi:intraflagellar transport-associated protein [Mustelus asterias]